MTSVQYPSGRTMTTSYDGAGRASSLQGTPQGGSAVNYAGTSTQAITYWAHGAPYQINLGNTLTEQWSYNSLLQAQEILLGTTAGTGNVRSLTLTYPASGNNGNLTKQTIAGTGLSTSAEQNYKYDRLNRIQSACEGTGCTPTSASPAWRRGFDYDWFGNGWVTSPSGIPASTVTPITPDAYDALTNRMTGTTPDDAGNQTVVAGYNFKYDAENRMSQSAIAVLTAYQYDGEGRRVVKVQCGIGAATCDTTTSGAVSTWFVYDAQGQLAAEYTNGTVAAVPCTTCYLTTDHLGSTRVVTSGSGAAVECHDYLPFGEEILAPVGGRTGCYGSTSGKGVLFTGKERDRETESGPMPSGLDYFGARYFSGAMGRFTSPDAPLVGQHATDPQTWNLLLLREEQSSEICRPGWPRRRCCRGVWRRQDMLRQPCTTARPSR